MSFQLYLLQAVTDSAIAGAATPASATLPPK